MKDQWVLCFVLRPSTEPTACMKVLHTCSWSGLGEARDFQDFFDEGLRQIYRNRDGYAQWLTPESL